MAPVGEKSRFLFSDAKSSGDFSVFSKRNYTFARGADSSLGCFHTHPKIHPYSSLGCFHIHTLKYILIPRQNASHHLKYSTYLYFILVFTHTLKCPPILSYGAFTHTLRYILIPVNSQAHHNTIQFSIPHMLEEEHKSQ